MAKFSIYVFDITDSKNKIPLTSNSEGWHDKEYILSNSREMEINYDYGYVHQFSNFKFRPYVIKGLKYLTKKKPPVRRL